MAEFNLKERRAAYSQALEESLAQILAQLSSNEDVEKVILFGSYAAGCRDLFTDLDLIVVMDTNQDYLQRTTNLYQQLIPKVDVDLLVYTPEEFQRMCDFGFVRHAVQTGQVVYEKHRAAE